MGLYFFSVHKGLDIKRQCNAVPFVVLRYVLALDIRNLHRVFRYVLPLKSGLSGPSSWGLGAARWRNLPTHDKWYQSEPWSMLSGTDLQDTMAFKSYGDNCLDPRICGDFHFCNVWACRGDLKECTAIASGAMN
ncbi:hypothetical protein LguiB_004107 [Lonicera macranthoides]